MEIGETELADVKLLKPQIFKDERGFFFESYNAAKLKNTGLDVVFVQDNHSLSACKATVRGLHYQSPPHAQDKLVRVSHGAIFDVAVDIRKNSPNYGKWFGVELSSENGLQLFVPKGFLHGFMTLVDDTEVQYKCSDIYAPECDGSVRFDDDDLAIKWPLPVSEAILSEKDAASPQFADFVSPF